MVGRGSGETSPPTTAGMHTARPWYTSGSPRDEGQHFQSGMAAAHLCMAAWVSRARKTLAKMTPGQCQRSTLPDGRGRRKGQSVSGWARNNVDLVVRHHVPHMKDGEYPGSFVGMPLAWFGQTV